jgi:transcription elongation GreA/GreB family factor
MNKQLLLDKILATLEATRQQAIDAAMEAYNTATAEENVAENKYDTLGLEASYLAQGQAQRVADCEEDIMAYKLLAKEDASEMSFVSIGALVTLMNEQGYEQKLFLGPRAGGLVVTFINKGVEQTIKIITPLSPIGTALLKREEGDEFKLVVGSNIHHYEILDIC